jgi:uroporphyrin-III C-methyltransferase
MQREAGTVLLVGAGPGAADLLTVRALRAIESAQALVYDALVDEEVLAQAPAACLRIQAGKRAGKASLSQETINRLMFRLAERGLRVVRLKGGDPSIFGRSGEEADYLEARGIRVEIVPGVTAASAAAAQFGFPLTHRGEARRLVFATARSGGDGRMVSEGWAGLADPEATVALYMGRDCATAAAERLMAEGRSAATPAIAVENAGRPQARLLRSQLSELGSAVEGAGFTGPVLLLIGEAMRRALQDEVSADAPERAAARA